MPLPGDQIGGRPAALGGGAVCVGYHQSGRSFLRRPEPRWPVPYPLAPPVTATTLPANKPGMEFLFHSNAVLQSFALVERMSKLVSIKTLHSFVRTNAMEIANVTGVAEAWRSPPASRRGRAAPATGRWAECELILKWAGLDWWIHRRPPGPAR